MKDNNQLNELSLGDIEFVEEINEEENKEIISILTDIVYNAPYEQYVINFLNKIIKENYKKIDPLFVKSNYNIKDLVKEFQNPDIFFFLKKKTKRIAHLIIKRIQIQNQIRQIKFLSIKIINQKFKQI